MQTHLQYTGFVAQLLNARIYGDFLSATHDMRQALEEELDTSDDLPPAVAQCRVQTATVWIKHAAANFLVWAYENVGYTNIRAGDVSGQYIVAGALYQGEETVCLERWAFWLDRFDTLAKMESELNGETQIAALEAAQTMRMVQDSMASTAPPPVT